MKDAAPLGNLIDTIEHAFIVTDSKIAVAARHTRAAEQTALNEATICHP